MSAAGTPSHECTENSDNTAAELSTRCHPRNGSVYGDALME